MNYLLLVTCIEDLTSYISFMDIDIDFTSTHHLINREPLIHCAFGELFKLLF